MHIYIFVSLNVRLYVCVPHWGIPIPQPHYRLDITVTQNLLPSFEYPLFSSCTSTFHLVLGHPFPLHCSRRYSFLFKRMTKFFDKRTHGLWLLLCFLPSRLSCLKWCYNCLLRLSSHRGAVLTEYDFFTMMFQTLLVKLDEIHNTVLYTLPINLSERGVFFTTTA